MADNGSLRPWREIARELARETDTTRMLVLCEELNEALKVQGMDMELMAETVALKDK